MASVADICNMALGNIRAATINDLDTDTSVEAQNCRLRLPYIRQAVLRDAPWKWARKIAPLGLTSHTPKTWQYAYSYPNDCIKLRYVTGDWYFRDQDSAGLAIRFREGLEILDPDPRVPHEVGQFGGDKVIMADEPEAYAVYTIDVTDPNKWDPHFILMITHYLASQIAVPIVGRELGRQYRDDEMQQYMLLKAQAQSLDGNENYRGRERESDFVSIRSY